MKRNDTKIICLDIGGSSVKSGVLSFKGDNKFSNLEDVFTVTLENNTFVAVENAVNKSIEQHAKAGGNQIDAVGISTSGSVDKNEIVISAGHFEGYQNINWSKQLKNRYNFIKHIAIANDGRASALGEYSQTLNPYTTSHIHLVVGTGVGGGIIHDDKLLLGESGQAGYLGHQKIYSGETVKCSCGKQGCVESLASAPAIVYQYLRQLPGEKASFETVINLAKEKQEAALHALKNSGYYLGIGIGNALNILNTSSVTVGGGVVVAALSVERAIGNTFYFDAIERGFKFASHRRVYASAEISPAKLGNNSGMVGAAVLVSRKITKS